MERLCEQLDALLVEHLELVMAYQSRCERIGLHMNQGFLQLTQAKFIMGQRHLSSSQYDRRMLASLTVQTTTNTIDDAVTAESNGHVASSTHFQLKVAPFEMPVADNDEDGIGEPATAIEIHSPTALTSRHRFDLNDASSLAAYNASGSQNHSSSSSSSAPLPPHSSGAKNESGSYHTVAGGHGASSQPNKEAFRMTRMRTWTPAGRRDPVTWYGVLVPGALRAAQTQFRQSITDIVHLATLRANILAHEQRLAQLLAQKQQWQQEEHANNPLPITCSQEGNFGQSSPSLPAELTADWNTAELTFGGDSNGTNI
ncbi:hypothetical protein BDF19DRAFT_430347 [Syncephalis fuscata]|nr:hypothetical protein BDF19DRAFT_430347 [Syncephalis fuscata]